MNLNIVLDLVDIFKTKRKIFRNFILLINPISNVLEEPANVSEKFQKIVVEKRPFRKYGFLPLLERLIDANSKFKPEIEAEISNFDENIYRIYVKIAEVVKKEQYYLENLLKPTLDEMQQRKDFRQSWSENLESFRNFLILLDVDLKRFEVLLNEIDKKGLLDLAFKKPKEKRLSVIFNYLNSISLIRALNKLYKEKDKLSILLNNIQIKIDEFSTTSNKQLIVLKDKVLNMMDDVNSVINIIKNIKNPISVIKEIKQRQAESSYAELWTKADFNHINKFINNILRSIKERRNKIEVFLERIGRTLISRRNLLRFAVGTAGLAATAGIGSLLATKKQAKKPIEEFAVQQTKPEEPDLIFDNLAMPEVNKIIYTEGRYKNAKYIVVIPHSSELNALEAGRAVAKGPITYVAGNFKRTLLIKTKEGSFEVDPNATFCRQGLIKSFNFYNSKNWKSLSEETQDYIILITEKFADEISRRIYHNKMVVALHQNTINNFGIRSYLYDKSHIIFAEDVFVNPNESNDVFAYVNSRGLFEVVKWQGWNVILQKNDNKVDDGSISFATAWKNLPYINIEVQLGDANRQTKMIETLNMLLEQYPKLSEDMNFVPLQKIIV